MADTTVRGRFVWHELITPDAAGAHAFYTKTVGWKTEPWELEPDYMMFVAASGPLGGTWARPSEGARWIPYIGTEHIEGTVDQARSLGARVVKDITEMKNGGKYALLEDPQGATFGVYVSASEPSPEGTPKLGEYSWHELATDDYQAAFDFYSALFGWEAISQHDMGAPLGVYLTFGRNGTEMGGMFKKMPDMPGGPFWLGYVRVKDVQQTIKKAKSAGGTVMIGPMEVPGGDLIAQFADPQGATFAVHMFAADIKKPAAEAPAEAAPATEAVDTEAQAAEAGEARRTAVKKAAKKPAQKAASSKAAGTKAQSSKAQSSKAKSSKKTAKKSAKKAAKTSAKKSSAKAGAKKKGVRKAAKKTKAASKKRGSATRGSKRPARKTAKAKKSARRPAKKKSAKRARKAK